MKSICAIFRAKITWHYWQQGRETRNFPPVNYLAHTRVSFLPDDPYTTLGKILPDLVRAADREIRLRTSRPEKLDGLALQQIQMGVNIHLHTDALFHNAPYFPVLTAPVKEAFLHRFSKKPRKYVFFYAHVLMEMVLDRLLLEREPYIAESLYSHLQVVEKETLEAYLRYKGYASKSEPVWGTLQRFTESAYLYQYRHNEGLLYALNRVCSRAGVPLFSEADNVHLVHIVSVAENTVAPHYSAIFDYIENQLKA
jgi:hypothetical protein